MHISPTHYLLHISPTHYLLHISPTHYLLHIRPTHYLHVATSAPPTAYYTSAPPTTCCTSGPLTTYMQPHQPHPLPTTHQAHPLPTCSHINPTTYCISAHPLPLAPPTAYCTTASPITCYTPAPPTGLQPHPPPATHQTHLPHTSPTHCLLHIRPTYHLPHTSPAHHLLDISPTKLTVCLPCSSTSSPTTTQLHHFTYYHSAPPHLLAHLLQLQQLSIIHPLHLFTYPTNQRTSMNMYSPTCIYPLVISTGHLCRDIRLQKQTITRCKYVYHFNPTSMIIDSPKKKQTTKHLTLSDTTSREININSLVHRQARILVQLHTATRLCTHNILCFTTPQGLQPTGKTNVGTRQSQGPPPHTILSTPLAKRQELHVGGLS